MKEYQDLNDYELMYMVSENNQDAKDLMYEKYRPLITNIAYKYYNIGKNMGLELEDFIQEGYFGLFQAISNFSDDKECLFYTYAFRSISSKMNNLCIKGSTKGNKALNESISLYKTLDIENDNALIDIIEDKNSPNPDVESDNYDFYKVLKDYIYGKSIIDGSILELKLNGFNINTISLVLGKTRSLVTKSLKKIKKELKINLHQIEKCN